MVDDKAQKKGVPTETNNEEYSYDEIHNSDTRSLQQNATNGQSDTAKPSVEDNKPDTPQPGDATATAAKPDDNAGTGATTHTEPVKPALDTDTIKSMAQEISQATAQEVVKGIVGDGKPETKVEKDELEELMETAPWVKDNRNPTYSEVIKWTVEQSTPRIKQQIMAELQAEAEAEEKALAEAEVAKVKEQEQANTELFGKWDRQLAILEQAGDLPAIVNKADPNDEGIKARAKLFEYVRQDALNATKEGRQPVTDLTEMFAAHKSDFVKPAEDKVINRAKNAPVTGGNKGVGNTQTDEIDYNEIHNMDIRTLVSETLGKGNLR